MVEKSDLIFCKGEIFAVTRNLVRPLFYYKKLYIGMKMRRPRVFDTSEYRKFLFIFKKGFHFDLLVKYITKFNKKQVFHETIQNNKSQNAIK